jgi:hypothetical protein
VIDFIEFIGWDRFIGDAGPDPQDSNFLLLQDGSVLLLEDGNSGLLLEP